MESLKDTEYLNWMIFFSARVCHDRDGESCYVESCYVEWYPSDWEWELQRTEWFDCSRKAIENAMQREKEGDYK